MVEIIKSDNAAKKDFITIGFIVKERDIEEVLKLKHTKNIKK